MDGQPVERRKIIQAASGQEIGYINLWVEIHTVENKRDQIGKIQKNPVVWDIESIPKKDYELRVIVWDTQDVPNNDPEDMSDIFVKVALNSLDNSLSGQTDTHIRSSDGFVRSNSPLSLLGIFQLAHEVSYHD